MRDFLLYVLLTSSNHSVRFGLNQKNQKLPQPFLLFPKESANRFARFQVWKSSAKNV